MKKWEGIRYTSVTGPTGPAKNKLRMGSVSHYRLDLGYFELRLSEVNKNHGKVRIGSSTFDGQVLLRMILTGGGGSMTGVAKLSASAHAMASLIRFPWENLYAVGSRSKSNSIGLSGGIGLTSLCQ